MQGIDEILDKIADEHPYKTPGDHDSYSQYNEGWQDAIDRVRGMLMLFFENGEYDGWIPVDVRLPDEKTNPVTLDFYEYQTTAKFGDITDVRYYKYGNGHWWHGPGIVDQYVIAWRNNPEPYCAERMKKDDRA